MIILIYILIYIHNILKVIFNKPQHLLLNDEYAKQLNM